VEPWLRSKEWSRVMSHYSAIFSAKSRYFLGNKHFSGKNVKKKCNFLHKYFSIYLPYMSHFSHVFNRKCIENSKKTAIFCNFLHIYLTCNVPYMSHYFGQKRSFPRKFGLFPKKIAIFCNFLHIRVSSARPSVLVAHFYF